MSQTEGNAALAERINWDKVDGLVPAVVQNAKSGQMLMLGYMNQDALAKTLETEQVTFWSRTKERLWTKGETSGNVLQLKNIDLDCDQDTLLVQVDPIGPTCHLGTESCFGDDDANKPSLVFLHQLEQVLASRRGSDPSTSYTASLYAKGTKRISQKVGEEGVEVALAATSGDKEELINESADLMYHLMVLLQDQGFSLEDVANKLKERHK
ncbi:bifunctional phosphoribosyl-AMP cyclohydrolase/phosphoribosyl-ATP diphosphatase HisIE [Enterovibrio makurazakiensis]|uniref:Histidine biosynthesis bifunctional protein HisIE n=1 Tax=Enterovibrio gelatinilyticus TaxID=2899819 RepID=A0ABT5QY92_9GAMM|nr:bifunctional phosphoribosyl-AMP cyclohydrolase/phosphoribosyl-ATP diphosphatase HisIE [Enterovibrio sp. ZSDZ42]MDD1792885.1 bifunctional phosphoribosyl-AMP cyclohydrolase/phosphoribosyl-ATP diphosphatase HisIE [Enterovibrio sp. ZSDZ42]